MYLGPFGSVFKFHSSVETYVCCGKMLCPELAIYLCRDHFCINNITINVMVFQLLRKCNGKATELNASDCVYCQRLLTCCLSDFSDRLLSGVRAEDPTRSTAPHVALDAVYCISILCNEKRKMDVDLFVCNLYTC